MEWSINEVARLAGTTSRTLRHYGDIGLLAPSRIAHNGYRYYDAEAVLRLQRILLLREFGLSLPAIADVLAGERDTTAALRTHLAWLEWERDRVEARISSVRTTLNKLEKGEALMAGEILAGFDHRAHEEEVVRRWGSDTWESGERWFGSLDDAEKATFARTHEDIAADFARANRAGESADGTTAQGVARRHYEWLTLAWLGTAPTAEQYAGLGRMYVDDPRFRATYDRLGPGTATFVRDAVVTFAERALS